MGIVLPWAGTGTGMLEEILHANPDAKILIRTYMTPPRFWIEANPDQLLRDHNGETVSNKLSLDPGIPSLASDMYINQVKQQFEYFIRYIHNSKYKDNIIGYGPDYFEWFYHSAS